MRLKEMLVWDGNRGAEIPSERALSLRLDKYMRMDCVHCSLGRLKERTGQKSINPRMVSLLLLSGIGAVKNASTINFLAQPKSTV